MLESVFIDENHVVHFPPTKLYETLDTAIVKTAVETAVEVREEPLCVDDVPKFKDLLGAMVYSGRLDANLYLRVKKLLNDSGESAARYVLEMAHPGLIRAWERAKDLNRID